MADEPITQLSSSRFRRSPPRGENLRWSDMRLVVRAHRGISRLVSHPVGKRSVDNYCGTKDTTGNSNNGVNLQSIHNGLAEPIKADDTVRLNFRSQVLKHFNANRTKWLRRERALLIADSQATVKSRHPPTLGGPVDASFAGPQWNDDTSTPPNESHALTKPVVMQTSPIRNTEPVEAVGRTVAREDKEFNSIPNCPTLNSSTKGRSLEVYCNVQPRYLNSDPHTNLLHPDELQLAQILRLDCATYLRCKRRIFQRRLECLHVGKEFLKTDAQKACNIDVNKASKLWTAFNRVGWFEKH